MAVWRASILSPTPVRAVVIRRDSLQVVDHYDNPRNVGKMDAKDPNVGTGLVGAPACGDVMKLQIKVSILQLRHVE